MFGAWAFLHVGHWIGQHWAGAKPAAVFLVARWLVAALTGFAIVAVFHWWGDLVAKAVHDGPLGWLDRLGGGILGVMLGLVFVSLAVLVLLQKPALVATKNVALRGVSSRPLVHGGAFVSGALRTRVPWGTWLHQQYLTAERRLDGAPARAAIPAGH